MRSAANNLPQIVSNGPNIGAFAAIHLDFELLRLRIEVRQLYGVHRNRPWFALHGLAFSSQLIQGLTIALKCRIHGWHLLDIPFELGERAFYLRLGNRSSVCSRNDFAFAVGCVGTNPELDSRSISFVRIE